MSRLASARPLPRWLVAIAAALVALGLTQQDASAAKKPPVAARGSCTEVSGKQLIAVFDVTVKGRKGAKVARGKRNKVTGGRVVGKLPTSFRPGATRRALRVAFARRSSRTRWRLATRTATVKRTAARCAKAKTKTNGGARTGTATPNPGGNQIAKGYCGTAAVTAAWQGAGRTIAASPANLTAAVASAAPGDTVELTDGVYNGASVTVNKAIRLKAAHPLGAVFIGGPTPRYANDTGLGSHKGTGIAVRASGVTVDGIELRYYDVGIDLSGVADVTIQGNRVVSPYGVGVQVWDTTRTTVRCNEILDPYLAQDPTATVTSGPSISEAQADYGVAVYGSLQPRIDHNYFHGVFNQTLSFKEGNWDPYAGYNTFEGAALTALFFGQNIPHNGPYSFTHLPVDNDRGTPVAEYNVFREVYELRAGAPVVYYMRSPIRVWHVNGATTLRNNVVEQAQQGVLLECRSGSSAGCNAGTTTLTGNVIAGRVRDLGGVVRQVNTTAGALIYTGLQAQATFAGNVFASLGTILGSYSDGVSGTPSVSYTGNSELAAPANIALRLAAPSTDPDLSFADALR